MGRDGMEERDGEGWVDGIESEEGCRDYDTEELDREEGRVEIDKKLRVRKGL